MIGVVDQVLEYIIQTKALLQPHPNPSATSAVGAKPLRLLGAPRCRMTGAGHVFLYKNRWLPSRFSVGVHFVLLINLLIGLKSSPASKHLENNLKTLESPLKSLEYSKSLKKTLENSMNILESPRKTPLKKKK